MVHKEVRILRRSRRPSSHSELAEALDRVLNSLVHGIQKSKATSPGYQSTEAFRGYLEYIGIPFGLTSFVFYMALYLPILDLSPL